ncbi:UDP-N-acetylglucosamine 2-epimerase [Gloeomargarita lithophora Alchichica-D10]|uniref:UDP-N-acetylglucosamine 2-epimerase (non-hydrolyzing) n=1 Tax=Gloeomargarita lithophora Alchichica-D10 TaxID=1188229 RepID=A0A1J0AF86_9CYAN|nr:UDP-N-acetylglucosamine 2-epimerase (non-hydrolyzing) [Gloeomargarita lithophora]APB34604.1 UDP-N-acetylglucosamine 2-epimerase [Gloeomargarita lithophora Alchichica-D10]
MPLPLAIVLGTRPEAIKLAPVIQALRRNPQWQVTVISTGQHREMVAQILGWFDLQCNYDLEIMQPGQTLEQITCRTLERLSPVLQDLAPRLVLVQGDTTTAFAAALASFYQQIPIAHVEAGLRTDNLFSPYPEEANRRLISQIAQLHFAPTPLAVQYLKDSRVTGQIHHTGNTVIDALLQVAGQNPDCPVAGLDWQKYRVLLATVHRRENWGAPLAQIAQAFLGILAQVPDTALVLPLHPNPRVQDVLKPALAGHPRIFLTPPLDYPQLVAAIQRCYLILTDSGGIQEEAPALGKPVLVLRDTTERPEAITAGTAALVGTDTDKIITKAVELLNEPTAYARMANAVNPFGDGQAAQRIDKIITEYFA